MELRKKADYYKWKSERTSFNIHQATPHEQDLMQATPTISTSSSQEAPSIISSDVAVEIRKTKPVPSRRQYDPERRDLVPHDLYPQGDLAAKRALVVEDIENLDNIADSALQLVPGDYGNVYEMPRSAPLGDVKCTCAGRTSTQEEVKGRIPTPVLRESLGAPARHHLDRTTPSEQGILIPLTKASPPPQVPLPYPPHSPKFRRDMKSSAPVNPLSEEDLRLLTQHPPPPKREAVHEDLSMPKHISTSASPYHAHCVPPSTGGGGERSASHVRKLDFDSGTASRPNQPPKKSVFSRSLPSSCGTCGATLQPSVPLSYATPPGAGGSKPRPRGVEPASVKSQPEVPNHWRKLKAQASGQKKKLMPAKSASHSPSPKPRSFGTGSSKSGLRKDAHFAPAKPYMSVNYGNVATSPSPYQGSSSGGERGHSHSPNPASLKAYTSKEGMGRPYPTTTSTHTGSPMPAGYAAASGLQPAYRPKSVDEVSISSMSSCSVASEILEKARNRRDHFWTSQYVPNE